VKWKEKEAKNERFWFGKWEIKHMELVEEGERDI